MIGDPIIQAECDSCSDVFEMSLTRTGRGWDDRRVKADLEEEGWITDGDLTFCTEECREDYYELGKDTKQ
jgi:hypothetical protein